MERWPIARGRSVSLVLTIAREGGEIGGAILAHLPSPLCMLCCICVGSRLAACPMREGKIPRLIHSFLLTDVLVMMRGGSLPHVQYSRM